MRLTKSIITGLTVALVALSSSYTLKSDVPGEFKSVRLVDKNYEPIVGGTTLEAIDFTLPPNIPSADDGYARINIGFPFEYNGDVYTQLWVCVNGFITFDSPNYLKQINPTGLFKDLPSTYQKNVVAPFWGDHIYRTDIEALQKYTRTKIIYKREANKITIEWRDLNIMDKSLPSSIANFQVILYKSDDPATPQGDIEFAYGQVGGNPLTNATTVVTKGASVGIKGEFDDFINGLYPCTNDPQDSTDCVLPAATDSTTLTNAWQPSGASNYRILFSAKKTLNVEEFWGDGDVDFSKTPSERHYGMPQNRYVTFNDVRLILRSLATQVPLDSVRRRQAYHGDVNHNGRYFYRNNGGTLEKVAIPAQDKNYFDNIPPEVTSLKKVFYEVNAHDAAMIITYLSVSIPYLPWLLDEEAVGKVAEDVAANNIRLGKSVTNNGVTEIPVYINRNNKGPLSVSFKVNGSVKNIRTEIENPYEMTDFGTNNVYYAGSGDFDANQPLFFVDVTDLDGNLKVDDIIVNEHKAGSITEESDAISSNVTFGPNPFVEGTSSYTVNVSNDGFYNLSVFDAVGNKVAELYNGNLNQGQLTQKWNAVDANGNKLSAGVYFLRLTGNNVNNVQKVVINK
ncbi:T9SS type A sorting domain-containing protein [bacterium]|nr:MAG: T9SS type A sorting domain-containing protein [bacterium]